MHNLTRPITNHCFRTRINVATEAHSPTSKVCLSPWYNTDTMFQDNQATSSKVEADKRMHTHSLSHSLSLSLCITISQAHFICFGKDTRLKIKYLVSKYSPMLCT